MDMPVSRLDRFRKNDEGFSLVELMVVMIILGVIATIAVPSFLSQRERSWNATAKSDARSMSIIVTSLVADGVAPTSVTVLDIVQFDFDRSPNTAHAICGMADGSFAVGAKHRDSTSLFIVAMDGSLIESLAPDLMTALDAAAGGSCDAYDEEA